MVWTLLTRLLALSSGSPAFLARQFLPDDGSLRTNPSKPNEYFKFPNEIKRVAVIGAGAAGVQHAAALVDHRFEVRLFERRPSPGGVWVYSPKKPLPAAFPDAPLRTSAYVPDIPETLPLTRIVKDGENGLSNDWRLREHWTPSVVWKNISLIIAPRIMPLPNVIYPDGIPVPSDGRYAGQKLREYITSVGFNSNDNEYTNVTSYSTRVERVQKLPGSNKWTLTLRKIESLPYTAERPEDGYDDLRVEYWTEEFDAVVVGLVGESDAPHVPDIPGLAGWAHKFPERVYHVREYRTPHELSGKNVLIVGDYLSAPRVAADLAPHVSSLTVSARRKPEDQLNPFQKSAFSHRFPEKTKFVGGIRAFSDVASSSVKSVASGSIVLTNGTTLSGFDHVILATGYRTSFPFLVDYHNETIKGYDEPDVRTAPILTDGTHFRSLHWTGHYIPDPTLVIAQVDPYTLGRFQSEGVARTWRGTARLPTQEQMWREYPGAGNEIRWHPTDASVGARLFVIWLNNEILKFGGRLVDGLRNGNEEGLTHYMAKEWPGIDIGNKRFRSVENTPRADWPVRNGEENDGHDDDGNEPSERTYPLSRIW